MSLFGITPRESRPATLTQCRLRGGAVQRGELVMLDLAGTDSSTTAKPGDAGSQATQGSSFATVLEATSGLAHGRVGVAHATTTDDALGLFELGQIDGGVADVVIDYALVKVGATSVAGAALQITSVSGLACFAAGVSGGTFATLLEDVTTNDGGGPLSTVNYARVVLHSAGKAVAGDLADLELVPDDVADPDIFFASKARYAAFSGKGPLGLGYFASITWDASQDNAVQFRIASRTTPSAALKLVGTTGASKWNFLLKTDGTLQFRENTTALADSGAGAVVFDGSTQVVRADFTGTTVSLSVDGVVVATGTMSTVTWASQTVYIGGSSSTEQQWPGLIYDVELVDNSTAANSVTLRMDERSGNYRNSYSGTTAAAYATRNGIVGSVLINDPNGSASPVPAVPEVRMRPAAFSGLGASSTAGSYGSVSWAPSAGTSFRLQATVASAVTPSGTAWIIGRNAAGFAGISVSSTGIVYVTNATSAVASAPAGTIAFTGVPQTIAADITDTTVAIYVNGVPVLATTTVASQSWSTSANSVHIGAIAATSSQRWPGSIHNAEFTDYITPANSRCYLMDEVTGDYADSSGNGGAAATRNGYVSWCAVASTDGRGKPVQLGTGAPLVYSANRNGTALVMNGGTATGWVATFNSEVEDPTGSLVHTTGIWTAPCAGKVRCSITALLDTGAVSDSMAAAFRRDSSAVRNTLWTQPATDEVFLTWFDTHNVVAGDTIDFYIYNISASNTTLEFSYAQMRLEFTPSPVTG